MPKRQRIRDPLHDLIEFDGSDFESLMWEALNAPEFQRLRRVKQLGFCELVYPGHLIPALRTASVYFIQPDNFPQ
jgi:HD superfamily phosphohydrolase